VWLARAGAMACRGAREAMEGGPGPNNPASPRRKGGEVGRELEMCRDIGVVMLTPDISVTPDRLVMAPGGPRWRPGRVERRDSRIPA